MRVGILLTGMIALLSVSFAPAPFPRQQSTPVERALRGYCARTGVARDQLMPCQVCLFPGSTVVRHRLPPIEAGRDSIAERHAVLIVSAEGTIRDLRVTEKRTRWSCSRDILAAMRATGKKLTNGKEAGETILDLMRVDYWLTGTTEVDEEYREHTKEVGQYRRRPNTYGGLFHMKLVGGDDLGLVLDDEGYIIQLVGGHLK